MTADATRRNRPMMKRVVVLITPHARCVGGVRT